MVLLAILLVSCTESLPPINFDPEPLVLKDTTYTVGTVGEPKPDKGILIEDLTGVRCVNCPDAAEIAKQLKDNYPSRVVVAGIYTAAPVNLTFPHEDSEDLRTQWATNIYTNLYGSPPLPGGGVNRKLFNGQNQINQTYNQWTNNVQTEMALKSDVAMELSVQEDTDSTVVLRTKFMFHENISSNTFVSIMLLENEIHASQSTISGEDHEYVHEHVLRRMYTAYDGDPLFQMPEEGRVIEKDFVFVIPDKVDWDQASFVVFVNVNDETKKEVLQVKEVKL